MAYDKPITIQSLDEETQEWADKWNLHAAVNYSQGSEYADSGSMRSMQVVNFRLRYFKGLKDLARNTQLYRIVYDGDVFNIQDYDDFMMRHRDVKIQAASYGE